MMHRTSTPGFLSCTCLATASQLFPTPKAPESRFQCEISLLRHTCTHPHQHKLREIYVREGVTQEVLHNCLNHILAMECIPGRHVVSILPARVEVAGAVGHVHLVVVVHARVLLLVLTPDATREVFHQSLVLRAKLRACNSATVGAGFLVKTAAATFQVEQDILARRGGGGWLVVAGEEDKENKFAHLAIEPSLQIASG